MSNPAYQSPTATGGPDCRAFTLIELLAVLAIVAIVLSILVSALGPIRQRAQESQSANTLRHLVAANWNHANDHRGHFAYATHENNDRRWSAGLRNGLWDRSQGYLSPYLDASTLASHCQRLEDLLPPSAASFELGTGGFGYNSAYIGGTEGMFLGRRSATTHMMANPARTIMFASTAYATGDTIHEYPFVEPPFWVTGGRTSRARPSPTLHFRYGGHALVAWADGSVTREPPSPRAPGENPHGGDSSAQLLGWIGPEEDNGYWNPANSL